MNQDINNLVTSTFTGSENRSSYDLEQHGLRPGLVQHWADGDRFSIDEKGRIRQVQYASGVQIVRHPLYIMVRSPDATLWLGDKAGRWFQLD